MPPAVKRDELREQGVYALPDGEQVIACSTSTGGYYLYTFDEWGSRPSMALYRSFSDGRIFRGVSRTPWFLEDLEDTGRTDQAR